MKKLSFLLIIVIALASCKKEKEIKLVYFEVGTNSDSPDWRDSGFIIATGNPGLISQAREELQKPLLTRKLVNGKLLRGNGGYNVNAGHQFKWHFDESDWHLTDLSVEIYDGRPFSDLDLNISYWLDTVGRFAPWSGHIKREISK